MALVLYMEFCTFSVKSKSILNGERERERGPSEKEGERHQRGDRGKETEKRRQIGETTKERGGETAGEKVGQIAGRNRGGETEGNRQGEIERRYIYKREGGNRTKWNMKK